MQIVHVITNLQKAAGTSVFCAEVCSYLGTLDINCAIVVKWAEFDGYSLKNTIPIFEVKHGLGNISIRPDIVHIHTLWSPFLHQALKWAKSNKVPIVISPHGMLTPWALGQKPLKKWMALALYQYWDLRGATLIHVTAESELADVRRLGLKQPVVIAPLGVNVPTEVPPVRHNNPRIALFVSRIHPKKGLFNLVDAWSAVKKQSAVAVGSQRSDEASLTTNELMNSSTNGLLPWKFIIAGPDQDGHAAKVMERARAAGVEADFEIIGPVFGKQKDDLYAKADLFVLPTYSENFGVVVIEALAQCCPVITTKGTPWQELLGVSEDRGQRAEDGGVLTNALMNARTNRLATSGRCGWWIDIGVEPLVVALKEAMSLTDEDRYQLGLQGRALVEKKYTWPVIAEQMKRAYEWVLKGGEPPGCVKL